MTFNIISSGNIGSGLEIAYIGFSDDIRITRFGPAKRNQYIIHYVLSGSGYYNGSSVSAGQGFLITPDSLEEYHPDDKNPWHLFWIVGYGEDFEKILPFYKANTESMVFDFDFARKILLAEERMQRLSEGRRRRLTGDMASPFELLEIYMSILKNHSEPALEGIKDGEMYAELAKNYIESSFSRKITVEEITERLGISQPYLYKVFKAAFGKSPKQYLGDYRSFQAKLLLCDTAFTVSEIAEAVGFEDVLAFSRFFSSREGCSPSDFRKAGGKKL